VGPIIAAALRAPSGDNAQPWRIRIDENNEAIVHVALDEERARCAHIGGFGGLMSIGAFVESMRLEAGRRGLGAVVVRSPSDNGWRVVFGDGPLPPSELTGALAHRHTNRGRFHTGALLRDEVSTIVSEGSPGSQLAMVTSREALARAATAARFAEQVRFDAVDPHELLRWVRFSPRAAKATRDGLDVRLLALRPHERLALRLTGSRLATTLLRFTGGSWLAGRRAERETLASGAVGVIVQDDLSPESFVESGRTMLRAWLRAETLKLAFAPVTAAAMFPLSRAFGAWFSQRNDKKLTRAENLLREAFQVTPNRHVVFMFRVGVPFEVPQLRSARRALREFTTAVRPAEVST
jgi:hypothetical protein